MQLMPKRTKYRKQQKGRNRGKATRGIKVTDGEFGLQATSNGLITTNQIEAARVALTRYIKRGGKVWIKIFADRPITKKPAEVRMGKGKGAPDHWAAVIKPGMILFEVGGVDINLAHRALELAADKLPVITKIAVKPTRD